MKKNEATAPQKRGVSRRLGYLLSFVGIIIAWQIAEHVTLEMSRLPVMTAPKVNHEGRNVNAKDFYPVWVKQAVVMTPKEDAGSIDDFFRLSKENPEVEEEVKPVDEPDYVAMFQSRVRIDGVSDNGVFIHGQFFKVGDTLDAYTMQSPQGGSIVPSIVSIGSGVMIFMVADKSIRFYYGRKA